MKSDLISIVVPLFNREELVKETIESVLSQTYPNWEMVIVDDGSEDSSYAVVESYQRLDSRIKLFKRETEPKGAGSCRNVGIENATGQYLMFLDSDDLLKPECLERHHFAKKHEEADYWIFKTGFFDHNTKKVIGITRVDLNREKDHEAIVKSFFTNMQFWNYISAPLYRRTVFNSKNFRFDPRILSGQDKDFIANILLSNFKPKLADHAEPDLICRINSDTTSGLSLNKTFKRNYAQKAKFLRFHLENIQNRLLDRKDKIFTDYLNRTLLHIFNFEIHASQSGGDIVSGPRLAFKGEDAGLFNLKRKLLQTVYFFRLNKLPRGYKLINAILE